MLHAPMDYLDCVCFTGRTSIPIRCIVERVNSNGNVTSSSSSPTTSSSNVIIPNVSSTPQQTSTATTTTSTTTSTISSSTTTTTTASTTTPTATPNQSLPIITNSQTTVTTPLVSANSPNASSGSQLTPTRQTPTLPDSPKHGSFMDVTNGSSPANLNSPNETTTSDLSQAISSLLQTTQSSPLSNNKTSPCPSLQLPIENSSLIPQSSGSDKNSDEGGCSESVDTKPINSNTTSTTSSSTTDSIINSTTNNAVNNCKNIDEDDVDLDVNPANPINSSNENNSNNINNGNSVNITGNVSSNGDTSVNLSIGDKLINGKINDTISSNNSNSSNCSSSNINNNQRHLTNCSSPSLDLSTNNNNTNNSNNSTAAGNNITNGGTNHCQQAINVSLSQQLSPTSTLRSLFGLNQHYPFQANHHLNNNNINNNHLSHLQHYHHHHSHHNILHHSHHQLLTSDHSSSNNNLNQPADQSGNHSTTPHSTFPASISPSGVVEQDSFAIITSKVLFSNLVKTALLHLGYSESEICGAKGFIQLRNWKPLTLDQITDSVDATVGDIMGDISSIASLRIILHRPRTSGPNEIEDKLLQVLLAQSYSLLANSGNPVDQTLLAALMGRNNRLEAELSEETRGKFDQWYMQQVFNQYRQMATLAAAQAHHQQAAAAAAAVMAATNQQQKQAAAAALAAVVNAAAVSAAAGSTASGGGGSSVDPSGVNESLTRSRGAAAAAAAAVAAAANCQSLLNLDMDAASLASNASASSHSNHLLKDNHHLSHHSSKHHSDHYHHHLSSNTSTRGNSSSSASHLLSSSTGRSSESRSDSTVTGSTNRLDNLNSVSPSISSSGTASSISGNPINNGNNNNNNGSNSSINRTSPNAPGQYVRTRIRTSFDPEMELPKLHKWFSENQHPSRAQIQQYVKELNSLESRRGRKPLDVNNVVYWFKNARAAHKRHELKLVNGSQSPTLSNNNNSSNTNANNNANNANSNLLNSNLSSIHCRDPFDGRINLGRRGLSSGLIPGLIGDRLSGLAGLTSGSITGPGGLSGSVGGENYADSNGNEDLMGQMYDDDGSEAGQDDYDNDDMMMDDDCSSQISQTLDLSVRPMKRQRSDSSPPGSPISGPSSLSDLIRGTPPHTLASASSCHSNFNVKDEPATDDEDEDEYDDLDERDYYPVPTSRHCLPSSHGRSSEIHNLTTSNYLGLGSDTINGIINEVNSRVHHHSSSSSSHDRHHHSNSLNNGASSGSHSGQPDSPEEGRRIRRSRTFIDPTSEVPKLEQWFSLCTHPNHPQIVQYTDELNSSPYRLKYPKLEPKNIQFWFKNRRAKSKRQSLPISSSNTSPLTTTSNAQAGSSSGSTAAPTNQLSSSTSGPVTAVTTTTTATSSSSSSSLSPSIGSNCSVSSLSLSTSTGPVSTSVSSSALTIDRLIGH